MEEKKNILMSIIIPVYNVKKYLRRCFDSVWNGIDDRIEIILVDDGSTDGSEKMCDEFSENSNVQVIHQANGGLSSARNTGLKYAKGKYVFFLDSDDMVSPKFYECIIPQLEKNKYDIIEFKAFIETKLNELNPKYSNNSTEISSDKILERILKNEVDCMIWLRIYRKELFENILFPVGRNYEDIAVIYKLMLKSKNNLLIDSELYIYNLTNSNSITKKDSLKNMTDMYLSINEFYCEVKKYYESKNLDCRKLEYYKLMHYIYIYIKLLNVNDAEKNTLMKELTDYADKCRVNLFKYRKYDIKRFLFYKVQRLLSKVFRF